MRIYCSDFSQCCAKTCSTVIKCDITSIDLFLFFQLQEKRAEVSETLQGFQDVVQGAKSQATLSCQTLLLESIERHIRNYLAIIGRLQIEVASTVIKESFDSHFAKHQLYLFSEMHLFSVKLNNF